jgi:hypothetical protein
MFKTTKMKYLLPVAAVAVAAFGTEACGADGEGSATAAVQEAPADGSSGGGCTPGYTPCLPPASDYDCSGGTGDGPDYTGQVHVSGSDPYGLDADADGTGCE